MTFPMMPAAGLIKLSRCTRCLAEVMKLSHFFTIRSSPDVANVKSSDKSIWFAIGPWNRTRQTMSFVAGTSSSTRFLPINLKSFLLARCPDLLANKWKLMVTDCAKDWCNDDVIANASSRGGNAESIRSDRRCSKRNRSLEWTSKWRDSSSRTKIQQTSTTELSQTLVSSVPNVMQHRVNHCFL